MLKELNAKSNHGFHLTPSECKRIDIYSNLPKKSLDTITESEDHKFTFRRLKLPGKEEILLVAVHVLSRLHADSDTQTLHIGQLSSRIRDVESREGHSRTIVIGDLNMNPFDPGVFGANGLHAVMTRKKALQRERKAGINYYPFFYNPMWGLLGDSTDAPPGTFYRSGSEANELFWHMLDQVLLRPDLLRSVHNETLKILSGDGNQSFLSKGGLPNSKVASNHLPVLFKLDY